jgi:hypothetical protein
MLSQAKTRHMVAQQTCFERQRRTVETVDVNQQSTISR